MTALISSYIKIPVEVLRLSYSPGILKEQKQKKTDIFFAELYISGNLLI
jgi:hypothetical protein